MYRVKASVPNLAVVISKNLLTAQQAIEMYRIYEESNQNPEIFDEEGNPVALADLEEK